MTGPSAPDLSERFQDPSANGTAHFVIDAGVAIKWYVPEVHEAEARRFLDLTVHPMAPLLEGAYDLAVGPERLTVYDSCYLALARALGCRLVTADRAFYDALIKSPHGAHLHWVSDPI